MKTIFWITAIIISSVLLVRYIEWRSIYYPMKDLRVPPALERFNYEDVYFQASDSIRLNGWFVGNEGAPFVILFCHGNAGNISHRIEKLSMFHGMGLGVFMFDYRGYGRSSGAPSEAGLYKDAEAAYDYLVSTRKIPPDKIVLYGESLGGAVAIDLAGKKKTAALIVEEAFTSIREMSQLAYPFVPYFLFSSRFDSLSKIGYVACPKLIIHSADDEIVPFDMGRRLFDRASPPKVFLTIRGSHNTAFLDSRDDFMDGVGSFLRTDKRRDA